MIDHGYALALAATAVDFQLNASERALLDTHLRQCSACRAERLAIQQDAVRLTALPVIEPPAWVRGAIGRGHRSNRLVLLAAAALLILASAGVAIVGSNLREDRTTVVQLSATPGPSVRPIASGAGSMAIHCGPLIGDQATCISVIAAARGALLSVQGGPVTNVYVLAGSTSNSCYGNPTPCSSLPPNSYWVDFESPGGVYSIAVHDDPELGWQTWVPDASIPTSPEPS